MNTPQTLTDLQTLINNKVEESYNLEYKSADALLHIGNKRDKKDGQSELVKDVSAMANAAGGMIIYGIKEYDEQDKKHLPEKITPIPRKEFSKERLEQIIDGNILPRIDGLLIHPIPLEKEDEVVYVITIPKSNTAHQNTRDKRYYKRSNFEATAMLDYEIRDVMNRGSFPKLILEFEISEEENQTGSLTSYGSRHTQLKYYLNICLRNIGNVYANYVNYFVEVNRFLLDDLEAGYLKKIRTETDGAEYVEYYGENTLRDVLGTEHSAAGPLPKYGPSRYDPILPQMYSRKEKLKMNHSANTPTFLKGFANDLIKWRIYADNAPMESGEIQLHEIVNFKKFAGL